jgi:hypothetical protein
MAKQVAEVIHRNTRERRHKRICGVVGDSLNGLTDAIRKNGPSD